MTEKYIDQDGYIWEMVREGMLSCVLTNHGEEIVDEPPIDFDEAEYHFGPLLKMEVQ